MFSSHRKVIFKNISIYAYSKRLDYLLFIEMIALSHKIINPANNNDSVITTIDSAIR